MFDTSLATNISGVTPKLAMLDGEVCMVETIIRGVEVGTTYVVKVVAMAPGQTGEQANVFAVATTYGSREFKGLMFTQLLTHHTHFMSPHQFLV